MYYCIMGNKLVLDLETQTEVFSRNLGDMKISVCGVYNYETDEYRAYKEDELPELEEVMKETETIIGFNHKWFDMPVLEPYLQSVKLDDFEYVDIMERLQDVLGYRVSLEKVATATLGIGKSGHGLQAVEYFKKGQWEELIKYCIDDVKVTKDVYEYGLKNGRVRFKAGWESYEVPVDFT